MNRLTTPLFTALAVSLPALLDSAVKGTALLALIALLVLFMSKTSAATRHQAWLLGIVGLLLLPFLSAALPGWRVLPAWASISLPANVQIEGTGVAPVSLADSPFPSSPAAPLPHRTPSSPVVVGEAALLTASFSQTPSPAAKPQTNADQWLVAVWLIGATFLLFRLAGSAVLLRSSARHARLVTSGPLRQALDAACGELGMRRRVHLLVDERRIVPLVWGIFRTRLILPGEACSWDDSRLRAVLLHELAHIKRGDLLVMLLTHIASALHWFNPLVWLAAWRMHVERERACDDLVLTAGVKASDYAEHLLHVATKLDTAMPAGALAMARPSRLEGRLLAVLNRNLPRGGVSRSVGLLLLAVSLGIAIPMAMLRAQENEPESPTPPETSHIKEAASTTPPTPEPPAIPSVDSSASPEKKVPVLGNIPVVGKLFTTNESQDVLEIRESGDFFLNATPLSIEEASLQLSELAKANPNRTIVIRADKNVPYTDVMRAYYACRAAGLQNLSFAVRSYPDQTIDRFLKDLDLFRGEQTLKLTSERSAKILSDLEATLHHLQSQAENTAPATKQKLDQAQRELQQLRNLRRQQSSLPPAVLQAIQQARAQEAGLLASGLGADHPRVKALQAQIEVYEKGVAETHSSKKAADNGEIARIQLDRAESLLSRLTELEKQKAVSQAELERAKAEVEVRRAELNGDASAVARIKLAQAERELQRASDLYKAKLVSGEELDRAKLEVEIRKAELSGDPAAPVRAQAKDAENRLKRATELHKQNLINAAEYQARRTELESAKAELDLAASKQSNSAEILKLLDDDLRLAEEKLAILKKEQSLGFASELPVLRMQVELIALRRNKAAHEGKSAEVAQLFDEQIKLLEELHRAVSSRESDSDRHKTAIDIQREILALKREKAGIPLRAPRQQQPSF